MGFGPVNPPAPSPPLKIEIWTGLGTLRSDHPSLHHPHPPFSRGDSRNNFISESVALISLEIFPNIYKVAIIGIFVLFKIENKGEIVINDIFSS